MKIGILTHHYINNFGAFLQAYALREAVADMFPNDEVQIINCVNIKHFAINTAGWFRFYKNRENFLSWIQKIKLPVLFYKARKRDMVQSHLCFTAKGINKQKYDCIIVGSDEVWNYKDSKSNSKIKFGIGLKCERLIAYAPSVGKSHLGENTPPYVTEGIKKFSAISARDDLTEELVAGITEKKITRVLDPTFLSEFQVVNKQVASKPYILFYYCEHLPIKIKNQILAYARDNGLAVYGAGECDKEYSDITVALSPFEWIDMFRNAEFVFTGTFHGVVFSILNKKPFKVFLTNASRIKKVHALLQELGIKDRVIDKDFKFNLTQMKNEISYEDVYQIIDKKRIKSRDFLRHAIKNNED